VTVHNFEKCLKRSEEQTNAPWWDVVYRKAFPDFASSVSVRCDGWAQRGGIDRVITLSSGKTITVDEKVRSKSYPDILLEAWSSYELRRPGWVAKAMACDFIAYAFVPTQTCYLIPALQLRRAWQTNVHEWWKSYKHVLARNEGYTTISVVIPIPVLFAAIDEAMKVQWAAA
jgi:hypothetical protein